MKLTKFEKVLRDGLSKNVVEHYTVMNFCKEAKVSRGYFYTRYSNITDLFASVMTIQLRRTLRSSKNETMGEMFFRMLLKVKESHIFFLNIILISKDPRGFYEVLRKELAQAIENYLRPRRAFSVRQVELVANGIYAITYNWIIHECKHDIRDVYQCINLLLTNLNRIKRNSSDQGLS